MNASLRNFYRLLFGQKIESAQSVAPSSRKLRIESLEDRALLTAVALSTLDGSAAEGTDGNYGSWEISRTGATNMPCTVSFQLSSDSATYGLDYYLYLSNGNYVSVYSGQGSVTIPSGYNSVTVELRPVNDAEKEEQETVTLSLTSYSCGQESGSASGSGQVTIADNDDWEVSVAATDDSAAEAPYSSANYGVYTLTRSNETDTTHSLYVNFQLSGTASLSDYSLYTSSGSNISVYSTYDPTTQTYTYTGGVSIPSGFLTTTVELRPVNDAERELTETVVMTLTPSSNTLGYGVYTTSGSPASIDVADNDSWVVSVAATDDSAAEAPYSSANYGVYTLTRSNETDTTHSLYVNFQLSGTASLSDYSLYTSTGSNISVTSTYDSTTETYIYTGGVSIPSGFLTTTVELRPINDAERELTETVVMTLLPSSTEYGYGAYAVTGSSASVSIVDNDSWVVSVEATDDEAAEAPYSSANYGAYTLTRSNETDTTHALYVRFQMTGTASLSDYSLYTSTGSNISVTSTYDSTTETYIYTGGVSIPSGSTTATVQLRPNNDAEKEQTETAVLTLLPSDSEYGYGAYAVDGNNSTASVSIEDNDDWIVSIATSDATAVEAPSSSSDYGSYTVTRFNETDVTHSLNVRFQLSGTASPYDYSLYTSSGTSISVYSTYDSSTGTYIFTGSVDIPSGSTTATVELRPNNNAEREQTETATLTLLPSLSEYGYGAYSVDSNNSTASVSIEDNDDWTVSIAASDATATEGQPLDYGVYTITRSGETDTTYSLNVVFRMSGTAEAFSDYSLYSASGSSISVYSNWDATLQTYVYTGSLTIPSGSLSTTVELRPSNDMIMEETESAIMTLTLINDGAQYGYGAYSVSGSASSATIQIEDNDHWIVSVAATDDTAAEGTPANYGAYTITRSGETDYSSSLDVQFRMSGTATYSDYSLYTASGSSIYLYSTWDSTLQAYVYSGSVTIPANANSVAVELRPNNDSVSEVDDETAILTIKTSDYYAVSPTNGSATVTIEDNDLWKINVEATDGVAKERLPGVAQDYGYYTFTKNYSEENVDGDNTYGVTVYFDMVVYPDSRYYCATPNVDYTLSATAIDVNDTTVYLQNFYASGSSSEQTEDGTIYRYHYYGTIPPNQNSASIRLQAIFDWLDEGDLYDFLENPGEQLGEPALLEITDVYWSGIGDWDPVGSSYSDYVEIKDGAICKLRADSNNDGSINTFDDLVKKAPVNASRLLLVNADDDNDNVIDDNLERPVAFNVPSNRTGGQSVTVTDENDLAQTVAYAWIETLTPVSGGSSIEVDVYLTGPQEFVVWTAATKGSHIHYGSDANNDGRMDYETTLATLTASNLSYSNTFYVEADSLIQNNNNLSGDVLLHADVINMNEDGSDAVRYMPINTELFIDLDVDTDRDNVIDDDDDANEDVWTNASGAIILFNGDDDNNDHKQDNLDGVINIGDLNDIGKLCLRKTGWLTPNIPDDFKIVLSIENAANEDSYWGSIAPEERIRIFWSTINNDEFYEGDPQLIGASYKDENDVTHQSRSSFEFNKNNEAEYNISRFAGNGTITLGIEGVIPGAPAKIKAKYYIGTNFIGEDSVEIKVSPFIAFSHESIVETDSSTYGPTVFVSNVSFSNQLRTELKTIYNQSIVSEVDFSEVNDKWWQDPFEIGYVQSPYGSQYVILALPRSVHECSFLGYAKNLMIRNGIGLYDHFASEGFNKQNEGGNFEVMPGYNSKNNSLGTIVMAAKQNSAMDQHIVGFLVAQGVQDVVSDVNLSWMNLGHIDEIVSFGTFLGGNSVNNRARVASPEAAWALLLYAQNKNAGYQTVFEGMDSGGANVAGLTVNAILNDTNFRRWNFDETNGYAKKIQDCVIEKLGLDSTTHSSICPGGGAPSNLLKKVGYLEGNDTIGNGGRVQWELDFISDTEFVLFYSTNGMTWYCDGNGYRGQDFVSDSGICYILASYWNSDPSFVTASGNTYSFETFPSEDIIEMPVLFRNKMNPSDPNVSDYYLNAVAYTNNVVNSLVDGNTLLLAYVHGPTVDENNVFNKYVEKATKKVGFNSVVFCEDREYHAGIGSIHCATNVLRKIPSDNYSLKWWQLYED